jgi:nitrate/nitrite-specific signal transduction histidine kinase
MRERAQRLGAHLEIRSAAGSGTTMSVTVDLRAEPRS